MRHVVSYISQFVNLVGVLGFVCLCLSATQAEAQNSPSQYSIGIDEKIGQFLPLDVEVIDETGKKILLSSASQGQPFILSLVYYECPNICGPLLSSLANVIEEISLTPGEDFKIISISFDPDETPDMARHKKENFFASFSRKIPKDSWRFFTATPESLKTIAESVGFKYKKVADEWVHSGAIMAISPDGKIARYLLGISFLPFDVKMALIEASEGRTGPTISRFLKYCFSYDPAGRQYTFNILAVVGVVSLTTGFCFLIFLILTTKKKRITGQ